MFWIVELLVATLIMYYCVKLIFELFSWCRRNIL